MEMIPSSQSDEQELAAPRVIKKKAEDIKETVNRWRQETASPDRSSPVLDEWAMDIDVPVNIPALDTDTTYSSDGDRAMSTHHSVHSSPFHSSEAEVCEGLMSSRNTSTTLQTTPQSPPFLPPTDRPKTPSPAGPSNAPLPPTPVVLDAKAKTDQIIAQIKANAQASAVDSPDERSRVLELQDLNDSSSDEEDLEFLQMFKLKNKGKEKRSEFLLLLVLMTD